MTEFHEGHNNGGMRMKEIMAETTMDSPIGRIYVAAGPGGITRMEIGRVPAARAGARANGTGAWAEALAHLARAVRQLEEYFAGRRRDFDLRLDLRGTPLQQRVWQGLLAIPFGRTLTYGELARRVGTPRAARAVGAACGSNPVPLVVPCHRVIGSDGSLHGYGGGLWRKEFLLKHEGAWFKERNSKNETRKSGSPSQRALRFEVAATSPLR
ncbi:MAG: methylated-DNA--[protein]-cysteine S-methyltransferase [Candidatus Acidiferrales bacterium]